MARGRSVRQALEDYPKTLLTPQNIKIDLPNPGRYPGIIGGWEESLMVHSPGCPEVIEAGSKGGYKLPQVCIN